MQTVNKPSQVESKLRRQKHGSDKAPKVLFIVPYPTEGASNRYRVEQYLPHLQARGIEFKVRPFIRPAEFYHLLYAPGHTFRKGAYFLFSAISRLLDVVTLGRYDLVFVHREAFPFGPAIIEWFITRLNCPLVFDFDDAIYLHNVSRANRWLAFLKSPQKTERIIRYSAQVIAGNDYLRNYALRYNAETIVIPTPIDTDYYTLKQHRPIDVVTLGWVGSHSTASYLHLLDNVLPQLAARYRIAVKVVGGLYSLPGLNVSNHPWKLQNELTDLHSFDIGLMPMPDNQWTRSKCGFKLLQYMGVGVPSVASPVGVNRQIVKDGVNGFLADSEEAWVNKLSKLIEDVKLRREMGWQGRATVEQEFSVTANASHFIDTLYRALERGG